MKRIKVENEDGDILKKVEKIKVEGVSYTYVNNSKGLTTPGTWIEVWLRGQNIEKFLSQLLESKINYREELVIPA